jgi:transcriptional regulator with XRE-family HTH domain
LKVDLLDIPVMKKEPETLADRIRARLDVVRKSAAAVSLEAGLGRSAVQDILAGNSTSPRLDTIQKLTGPLQCSLAYLVGGTDQATPKKDEHRDIQLLPVVRDLESGVFRKSPNIGEKKFEAALAWALSKLEEPQYPAARDPRYPDWPILPCRIRDASLEGIGVLPGDVLMASSNWMEQFDLRTGQVVVLRRTLSPQNLDEFIARYVEETDDGYRLVPKTKIDGFESFEIAGETFGVENSYSIEGGWISIEGIVTSVLRTMPIA